MKQTYYANIYPPFAGSCGHVYATRQLADQMAAQGRIACVPFTCDLDDAPAGMQITVTPLNNDTTSEGK